MSEKEETEITFEIDPEKVRGMIAEELAKQFKDLKESLVPAEVPESETEPLEDDENVETDYRKGLVEDLQKVPKLVDPKTGASGWKWTGPEDNDWAKTEVGEVKVTDEKLQEAIGAVTATKAFSRVCYSRDLGG